MFVHASKLQSRHKAICEYKLGWLNVRIRSWFGKNHKKQALKIKVVGKDKIHANRSLKEPTLDQTTV